MKTGDITTWLAVWGAITGTIGLGWQIWTRRQAPNPNLKVELSMMASKHRLFGHQGITDAVLIQVTNRGPLPVNVVGAGFLSQDVAKNRLHFVGYGVELPQEVGPQRGLSILIEYEDVRKAIALSRPAQAWVITDTGQEFLSSATQVIRRGIAAYDENLEPTLS
jgi:hypothetical protein